MSAIKRLIFSLQGLSNFPLDIIEISFNKKEIKINEKRETNELKKVFLLEGSDMKYDKITIFS